MTACQDVGQQTTIMVGLGEMHVSNDPNTVLSCLGLGSCIGISAYDPVAKVGAMVHVVLPHSSNAGSEKSPARYADTALPAMLREMEKYGASRSRLIIKIAGGARIIDTIPGKSALDIGERNIEAVMTAIEQNRLELKAADLRGKLGRSMWLYIATGVTRVRTTAGPVVEL